MAAEDTKIPDLDDGSGTMVLTDEVWTDQPAQVDPSRRTTWTALRALFMPIVLTADVTGVLPEANGGTGATSLDLNESFIVAASDETTDLTVDTKKVTFRMPYAFTLTEVRASVTAAPTGSVITVDINEDTVTILSTKLTIDATEKTSETAAIAAVISDASLADDAEISIDIDTIGSTIAGAGLKVTLIGAKT